MKENLNEGGQLGAGTQLRIKYGTLLHKAQAN